MADQAQKLKKPSGLLENASAKKPVAAQKSLAEQLQEQLERMRLKSEAKAEAGRNQSIKKVESEPSEKEQEDDKTWSLINQLKSRKKALQGGSKGSASLAKKKLKYKEMQGLSDGDSTPSDFDPKDSDLDSGSGSDSD